MIRAALVALCLAGPVAAQPATIEGTIGAQIDAIGAGDLAGAFAFASPGIQEMFGSPGRFGAMVRQGYPMLIRPQRWRLMQMSPAGDGAVQIVQVRDAQGAFHLLEYRMIREDGDWRIAGVRRLDAPELGV